MNSPALIFLLLTGGCAGLAQTVVIAVPGSILAVQVATTGDVASVGIGGPGAVSNLIDNPPFVFQVQVPEGGCNDLKIVAFAKTRAGEFVYSTPRVLSTQCSPPTGTVLEVSPSQLKFKRVGQRMPIAILLSTPGQGRIQVRGANLRVLSTNPAVVVADANGLLTATGPGTATIRVFVTGVSQEGAVKITVPTTKRGDVDADDDIDTDDLAIIQGLLNTAATTGNDASDLNRDGRIDALDTRILTTLCTRPRCAVR